MLYNYTDFIEFGQSSLPTTGEKETNFMNFIGLTVLATSFAFATLLFSDVKKELIDY
ncbi:TPA: LPXTG cell wall anchor domain-containing protein [Streptococcus suis]